MKGKKMNIHKYKDLVINIENDENPINPRKNDNLGTMVCFHSRYNLGDEHNFIDPSDFAKQLKENSVILPLYLYDHSGLTINTTGFSCPWDSGQVGWIYVDRADIRKEYGKKKVFPSLVRKVKNVLKSEVEVYDKYLRGESYGYIIEDRERNHLDSCWGFDDFEYCLEIAKEEANYILEERKKAEKVSPNFFGISWDVMKTI